MLQLLRSFQADIPFAMVPWPAWCQGVYIVYIHACHCLSLFVLQRLRSFQADTNTECTVLEVQRGALEVMVAEVPAVATALQVRLGGGWVACM